MILNADKEIAYLKMMMLKESGISSLGFSELQTLARSVVNATGYCISTVTLSRIFGLMESKFGPSEFTLHVMCVYCGYEGWADFYKMISAELNSPGRPA